MKRMSMIATMGALSIGMAAPALATAATVLSVNEAIAAKKMLTFKPGDFLV